jgi:arabinogalactan endo-1,4-beta-galactosidase
MGFIWIGATPRWHIIMIRMRFSTTENEMENNLLYCIAEFGKDIAVVETGYPWTLQWFDNENNLVGLENQLLPGYAATPTG